MNPLAAQARGLDLKQLHFDVCLYLKLMAAGTYLGWLLTWRVMIVVSGRRKTHNGLNFHKMPGEMNEERFERVDLVGTVRLSRAHIIKTFA
ncbi:hypothetical protein HAD_10745 [Hyphomonas adhaerens MHS-3]|uniref:Uncharacterized protein n=1 Tax=Hyphomonas adhaerens MHS-3 TaxID=1280949 RepID=A0A069E7T3_9PROT|nr:hypothetical protein [Hyphomonas adhaerens]KCZ86158.1 hypothetical protein HAD_10745 [Hyphomonas adhaerens MHS-3]